MSEQAAIPMCFIGPIRLSSSEINDESIKVPLATYETTLWPSTNRGAKVSRLCGGIQVTIAAERMSRSILLEADSAARAVALVDTIREEYHEQLIAVVESSSRFCRLKGIHPHVVGKLIYLRLEFSTADAAGHNMATLASQHIQAHLLSVFPDLKYVSLSANYCVDKKVSSVNSVLGRGKYTIAECHISREICQTVLNSTPEKIAELNDKKNLVGSIAAGSLHSANAHFANVLLATYLATGQDAANIVEGSQGITYAESHQQGLYFSVTIPNLIVGTVGNGKEIDFVRHNLTQLGCDQAGEPGSNARRLAAIIAATVCCGELSLLAALTNQGELMRAHQLFERRGKDLS